LIRTIQAWGDALITWEAMKRADKAGNLTGPGIMKVGFESLREYDIGLGAAPITFTTTDHRPATGCLVQEWSGVDFREVERVDLKKRWPDKWEKDWLGW
jgi:branched-chain amino acid transport system substrate-binding protein